MRTLAFIFLSLQLTFGFGLPDASHKKMVKAIKEILGTTNFSLVPVEVPDAVRAQLPIGVSKDNFYRVTIDHTVIGYVFGDQAPSKNAKFDYMVFFDTDVRIKETKVLVYREEYGGEIGSRRWLKQFTGMELGDEVSLGRNIDAISGATISVRSMTSAMGALMESLAILKKEQIL